jgi:hypothetical protein
MSGYKNGYVHLWDASAEQPAMLGVAPSPMATAARPELGGAMRPVTALEVVVEHGMIISGHAKGG